MSRGSAPTTSGVNCNDVYIVDPSIRRHPSSSPYLVRHTFWSPSPPLASQTNVQVRRVQDILMSFDPSQVNTKGAEQPRSGVLPSRSHRTDEVMGRAYHGLTDAIVAASERDPAVAKLITDAVPEPIPALGQTERNVKDLFRRCNESAFTSEPNNDSVQADQALQGQLRQAVLLSEQHYRNRDAAIYAIAILHMTLDNFAREHTPIHPTFDAHKEVVEFAMEELRKFPEDVLGDFIDQFQLTASLLCEADRRPSELQTRIAQGLQRLVTLAESRMSQREASHA